MDFNNEIEDLKKKLQNAESKAKEDIENLKKSHDTDIKNL